MFLVRGGGIPPGELFGFSSADARTEGTRTHAGSLLLGAGAAVGGLQQHPPLGWLFRSREAWVAARKGLPGCPQPRCKAGGFLPPADVARTPFTVGFMEVPAGRHVVFCHLTSKLFPFLPFPKLIKRDTSQVTSFSLLGFIYLFSCLHGILFLNFYFSHTYLKTAFQASWGLVGCLTSSAVGIPLCLLPAPGIPFSSLPLQPFVQEP